MRAMGRPSYEPGTFSWTDLHHRRDAAKALYRDLFGWDYDDQPIPGGGVYTMASSTVAPSPRSTRAVQARGAARLDRRT